MRAKLLFLLLPLLLLAELQAGDPGRKWRISVGWSYFLSNGGELPNAFNQKGPNNWFFPSLGFEYRFRPKWNVSASVTPHPYMLITKYQVGRDMLSWREEKYVLGITIGPTLSWSSRDDKGFNYKFDQYENAHTQYSVFYGALLSIMLKAKIKATQIRFFIQPWLTECFIKSYSNYYSYFFDGYKGFVKNYYNNPINDQFQTIGWDYNYRYQLNKSIKFVGLFVGGEICF